MIGNIDVQARYRTVLKGNIVFLLHISPEAYRPQDSFSIPSCWLLLQAHHISLYPEQSTNNTYRGD